MTEVTEQNWASEVLASPTPVLVDFWAPWCAPCVALGPVLHELERELAGRLKIAQVNVDTLPQMASQFGIRSIPTLLVFKNGVVQQQMSGMMSKAGVLAKLDALLAE